MPERSLARSRTLIHDLGQIEPFSPAYQTGLLRHPTCSIVFSMLTVVRAFNEEGRETDDGGKVPRTSVPRTSGGGTDRPVSRSEYDRMVEQGLFEDQHVELLYGVVESMSPQGYLHSEVIKRLSKRLIRALGDRADVFIQAPFAASQMSEPEPDLAVVPADDYSRAHPDLAHLIIEVGDSSLPRDRGPKSELYANSLVPEYWIVDLVERVIEVRCNPVEGQYRTTTRHQHGDAIPLLAFPDVSVVVDEIL